jgi:hypothetical protein
MEAGATQRAQKGNKENEDDLAAENVEKKIKGARRPERFDRPFISVFSVRSV